MFEFSFDIRCRTCAYNAIRDTGDNDHVKCEILIAGKRGIIQPIDNVIRCVEYKEAQHD